MKENDKNKRGSVSSREELLRKERRTRSTETSHRHSDEPRTSRNPDTTIRRQRTSADPSVRRQQPSQRTRTETTRRSSAQSSGRKRKKKKKKSWIKRYYRLIIVLFVFFLIVAFLVTSIVKLFSGSKGTVVRAYAKTIHLYEKRTTPFKAILGKDVAKIIDKGNVSRNFTLALTDNTAGAQGISLSGQFDKNTSSKTAYAQLNAAYQDAAVAGFKMYTDNKKIMFSAPGLYDDWLEMDCDNIMTQLSASPLASDTEFSSDEDFSLKMFTDEQSQGEIVLSLSEELSQVFTKEINSLSKKADYKRIKEKKAIAVDGTEKNCRGYELTINDGDFKNFLINVLSSVRRNKKIKTYLTRYAEIEYENVPAANMLFENSDRLVDNYYRQMDEALDRLNKATFSNTGAEVYIYKGVIADLNFKTVYSIDEDQMNIALHGGMYGGKRPYEDFDITLALSDDSKSMNISYAEETDDIDSTLTHTSAFMLGDGKDDLTLSTKVNFDKITGVINGSAELSTPSGGYVDISGSGMLTKSKGATKIDAQEIRLDYNGSFNLTMDGSYEIKQLSKKIDRPDGNVTELFKADAAKIDEIESTIADNLDNAVDSLNKALDSLNFTIGDTETEGNSEQTTAESETTTEAETETTTAEETDGSDSSDGSDTEEDSE